jgi:predicted ATPase/DNA-binding CsgD family transcriptional regulator
MVTTATGGVRGFPAALTSFIGRDGPLREVAALLEQHRLVTVTGPGGAGKTRLASQVAERVADRFADGAWLVELAPVQDPAQVAGVVAAALEVREQPGIPAAEAVGRVLARQQLLLVLDNCEHVIAAAAQLCAGLLAACDDVRVLATSREPLAVAGEARYRLGPLTLPGPGEAGNGGGSEAVALFADRARAADAHFTLDKQTAAAVAELVARLDGMPLAIELAAARVEALGVGELLARLDDRPGLLAGADRLAPSRQRSLAATVDWSYRLLDQTGQRVFRAISVFPGPFTLAAAESVAGEAAGEAVLHLVDCSLLVPPRPGPDGRARYLMLQTLRAYSARLLADTSETGEAGAALAGYALEVAEQGEAGVQTTTGELAAARMLDAEDPTTRQALTWARQHNPATALQLVNALAPWWALRGRLTSHYALLGDAAAYAEPGNDAWCMAKNWLGLTAISSGDPAAALAHFTELRDAAAGRPPSRALAEGLYGRAAALNYLGRAAEAAADAGNALTVAREIGYPTGEATALMALSAAARVADRADEAIRLAWQAVQVDGDIHGVLRRVCSWALTHVLIDAGHFAAAEPICAAALVQAQELGDAWNLTGLLSQMADLDLQAGRIRQATGRLNEGLRIALRSGNRPDLLDALRSCGDLCAATGRAAEAVTAWAAAAALSERQALAETPAAARRRDDPLRRARQALEAAPARAAQDRGAAMSWIAATEYALLLTEEPGPPSAQMPPGPGTLSARERELVTLVAQGTTDAQIAAQLYISIRTVRSHLDRIRDKTGCRRRADLTRLALTTGLI